MIKQFIGYAVIFGIGFAIGNRVRTNKVRNYCIYLASLIDEIKERNNQMVMNLAQVYAMSEHDETEFTEFDAMLIDMWMN